jgi:hypothetical protein
MLRAQKLTFKKKFKYLVREKAAPHGGLFLKLPLRSDSGSVIMIVLTVEPTKEL